ncbi:ferric reductase like transmembrane component-domain-containing protein [Cadophora sp. MPI-SDFR-AT-0126]|nr:ferric reductase like transmembrane component-domain-containing protein [Leotiomycetes sp. MPI-SDFR-AT-0126]
MDMNPAWLTFPLALTGSRTFECGDFTEEECTFYMQRWHFWYIADLVFALPTVAFFMCGIGVFIISYFFTSLFLDRSTRRGPRAWRKLIAGTRYLSYRGFHVESLKWNSAPVGVLMLGAIGTIYFFCMDLVPSPYYWSDEMFGGSPPLATRSGWLALGCMPFVFATATKTNWITLLTGISHERLQVFHRWIAYAFFILALLHTFPFIVYHVHWHDMQTHFSESLLFYWTGIVAIIFQAWLTFMSHSTIRSLGYEFFKITHFASAIVFMVTFFWHCDYTLTSWHYFVATAAVYVPCFIFPWLRTLFEYGFTQQARVSVEDNGFTRVVIPVNFNWTPGQHCFLRFTGFGVLQAISSHPFTICSMPSNNEDEPSELIFFIRHQRGFTAKLHQYALDNPGGSTPVQIDGPYGGVSLPKLRNSERLLVIAGGSGAGWCLPFIESFFRTSSSSSISTQDEEHGHQTSDLDEKTGALTKTKPASPSPSLKPSAISGSLRVVLATRDTDSRLWFERSVASLFTHLSIPSYLSSLAQIQVFVTGSAAAKLSPPNSTLHSKPNPPRSNDSTSDDIDNISSDNEALPSNADEYVGRPELAEIVGEEARKAADAGQELSVYVCGPCTMQNDVRNAVAESNLGILRGAGGKGVYLYSEHFTWA